MLLLIGLGHAALLLALIHEVSRPNNPLPSTPLTVSLVLSSDRSRAEVADPPLPQRARSLPEARYLPIPPLTIEPDRPSRPMNANPHPEIPTSPTFLLSSSAAAKDDAAPRVEAARPLAAAAPLRKRLAASDVQYLVMPPAEVPRLSRRAGESGVVWLRVIVDAEGVPSSVTVQRSSGFTRLDEQALWAMRQARFTPYLEDGRATEVEVIAPIEYPSG